MWSRILKSNPFSPLEGHAKAIKECWDFVLEKGEAIVPHYHPDVEEVYIILEGEGIMVVGEKQAVVLPGEVVHIPIGKVHCITNPKDEQLRCLTIVCKPVFHPRSLTFSAN